VITLPRPGQPSGHLLLVASSELPMAFYTGTLTASLGILIFSVLLWLVIARQIKRLITRPIHELEELSRQVTREENYALRAPATAMKSAAWPKPSTPCCRASKPASSSSSAHGTIPRPLTTRPRAGGRNAPYQPQAGAGSSGSQQNREKLTGFQNYLNSIIDSMPSALIALDEQLYVTQWNQEASALSGTRLDEALNQPIFLAFEPLKPFCRSSSNRRATHGGQDRACPWVKDDEPKHTP
jgi:PAS domain-containing protein